MLRRRRMLLLAWLLCACAGGARAASFPPGLRFRTLSTARVSVHFHQGLEATARRAAALADEILAAHEARYHTRVGRVQVVLADIEDDPNGFATPFPLPLVHVRVAAPDGSDDLGAHDGWLRLVLTHELAHVVHLNEARGILGAGRKLFGRAPFLFPNSLTPTWMIEGLATHEETQGTPFGRGRNPDSLMVVRMATLEGRLPKEDRPVAGLDAWPGGQAAYLFGESFLRHVAARYGDDALPRLAETHARRPVPFLDELTFKKVTGRGLHQAWREWQEIAGAAFQAKADEVRRRGVTDSTPLTQRGIRQIGARYSPDGSRIAYTSGTLDRYRAIRVMRADGGHDRRLVLRNGGNGLAWTPDGKALVFDESEVHRLFETRSDLRLVELETRRVRRLTRGMRARDPDVFPDGVRIAFVRRFSDRSELFAIGMDGGALRQLTNSEAGTEWSGPRVDRSGTRIAASRLLPDGRADIVIVDVATGAAVNVTDDRAKDVEPSWTEDGSHLLFRSDRDGISNVYAWRASDGAILRLTNVLGGAFAADAFGDRLLFSRYAGGGYDLHTTRLDLAGAPSAEPYVDRLPPSRPPPEPVEGHDRPYRPMPALWPRFWSPYVIVEEDEARLGAATFGVDPLFRHAYAADVQYGFESERKSVRGFYQYDRFRPTFTAAAQDRWEPAGTTLIHEQELSLRATLPVRRSLRMLQSASLAWRRRRETIASGPQAGRLDLGAVHASYAFSSARRYPYSISPLDGWRATLGVLKEAPGLGSDVSLAKLTADARGYLRLGAGNSVMALRAGGGTTFGRPGFRRSFAAGGFPDGSAFDVVQTNPGVLRGYPQNALTGRHTAYANAELRLPLGHPQRGWHSAPLFVRHLHAAAFVDAGHAWTGAWRARDLRTSAGAALGADLSVSHAVPLTATLGIARGFTTPGETRGYFRLGLAF